MKEPIERGPFENVFVVQFHIFPKNMASSSSFVVETSEQISEISNEKLMDCIRNYRSIYDKKCKDYKVPQKKKNAWKEVSAQLDIDIDEAQRRYNSIRTNFAKYRKRMRASARSGSGRADLPEIREEFRASSVAIDTHQTQ